MSKLNTYQQLVVDAINTYGSGDWKIGSQFIMFMSQVTQILYVILKS